MGISGICIFRPQLTNLQPVQLTELESEFTKIDGQKAVPTRYIRSQQKQQAKIAAEAEEVDGGKDFGQKIISCSLIFILYFKYTNIVLLFCNNYQKINYINGYK